VRGAGGGGRRTGDGGACAGEGGGGVQWGVRLEGVGGIHARST
jgi:hypothetical protein